MTILAAPGESGGLPLGDIQGNILSGYGKEGFPKGRFLLINVRDQDAGRALIRWLYPSITTALRWPSPKVSGPVRVPRPEVATNIAFTFWGLFALGVPVRTLDSFPSEFIDGMARRSVILGDRISSERPPEWDPVWAEEWEVHPRPGRAVHILITLNAQMTEDGEPVPALDERTRAIRDFCAASDGGLALLAGHDSNGADFQELSAVMDMVDGKPRPTAREHFGFVDGISDPVFAGQFAPEDEERRVQGNGKLGRDGKWRPLATGEFLLGYPDEAQEIPVGGMLRTFGRNGTFIAYRKLHQNVVAFRTWLDTTTPQFGAVYGIDDPEAARATLLAKIAGRWPDGLPLSLYPDYARWRAAPPLDPNSPEGRRRLADFAYFDDPHGVKCPVSAHTRRANPRDGNGPLPSDGRKPGPSGTVLTDRRRILRRGLPYGMVDPTATTEGEHGIVMLIMCANLGRQFEFMQQQWVNYGADAQVGNDPDPLIGVHPDGCKFVVPADPLEGRAPFIAAPLPPFVETRGGAYFFCPSMNSLQMLAMGAVDPT